MSAAALIECIQEELALAFLALLEVLHVLLVLTILADFLVVAFTLLLEELVRLAASTLYAVTCGSTLHAI